MDIDTFSIVVWVAIFLLGIITSTISEVIRDILISPYRRLRGKKEIKKENLETVKSWLADFCSTWELFKCKTIPSVDFEKDLINICKEIYNLISKNEGDFRKNDVGTLIKNVCKKFINLHPQNNNCIGWSQGVESQIDELYAEFMKYKEMLEKW